MSVNNYQDLLVWQKAMELATAVYGMTRRFPKDEIYGLTSQMRRAAVSIASNIAEGQGRGRGADFVRHLRIAQGSLQEIETQALLAIRLGFIERPHVEVMLDLAAEVGRLNRGLQKSLN